MISRPLGLGLGISVTSFLGFWFSPLELRRVEGQSMQPTLNPDLSKSNDILLLRKVNGAADLGDGDVIAFLNPRYDGPGTRHSRLLVKRVSQPETLLPENHLWVLSDAGPGYVDSTSFGPLPRSNVQSKALLIVWPLSRFGKL